jgi:uncharacterized RDD family membrane protein YckC
LTRGALPNKSPRFRVPALPFSRDPKGSAFGLGIAALLVLCLIARAAETPSLSQAPPQARPRDLLAEAGEDHFWIAHVVHDPTDNSTETDIFYRSKWTGNAEWVELDPVSDRVVSMATSNGELLVVLADGQWQIADDDGMRAGPDGLDWKEMVAVGSDSSAVWSIVRWQPPSTMQSEISTTAPATAPATQPAVAEAPAEPPPRLMVCQFSDGQWMEPERLPDGVSDDPAQMSMTVVGGMPVLAWRTPDGRLCVSRLGENHTWSRPVFVDVPADPFDFKLLTIRERSVLWIGATSSTTRPTTQSSTAAAVGEVLIGDDFKRRIPLKLPATLPATIGPQTLVAAFGNLRWIAYAGSQQIEQDFNLDTFPSAFPPVAPMSAVPAARQQPIPLDPWIAGDALLVLVAGVSAFRQRNQAETEASAAKEKPKPSLAPLGVRFVAGLVDFAPIFAIGALVQEPNGPNPLSAITRSLFELLMLGIGTYVLHTLVAELICGQSIGKMVFGLRVLDTEGKPPGAGAIIMRNLLRGFDVMLVAPLLIMLITPLHQRVGDLLAGTVVVSLNGEEEEETQ